MKKQTFLVSILLFLGALILSVPRFAAAGEDPVNMLQSVANQMISGLKANKANLKNNPTLVYSLAYKIVVPHADLDYMSKRVLPPQVWNKATAAQKAEFKRQFTTLLVHTYASALSDYTDQTVRFYPIRGGYAGRSNIHVESEIIRSQGPSIPVSYSLISAGAGWRLFDMSVQGISMLESFRSQFADKLAAGNMDELIASLREHNAAHAGE